MKSGIENRNYFEKLKNRGEKCSWKKRSWQNRGRGIVIQEALGAWLLYPAITLLAMSKGEIANLYEF